MCILVIKGPDAHGSSELVSQNHQFSNNLKTIKSTCHKTELGIVYFNDTKASTPLASPCAAGAAWPPGSLHRQAFPVQAMSSGQYCLSVRPSVCLSVCLPTGERHQLASKDDCEDLLAPNVERLSTKPMTTTVIAINYPLQQLVNCHFLQPLCLALYLRSKGISLSLSLTHTHTHSCGEAVCPVLDDIYSFYVSWVLLAVLPQFL